MWQNSPAIEAVIFDYAGVIGMPTWDLAASSLQGRPVPHHRVLAAMAEGYGDPHHPWCCWERGELSFDEFRSAMARHDLTGDLDWSTLTLSIGPVTPIAPIVDAAQRVRSSGRRIALLSNTMHELAPALDAFDQLFEMQFRSCELGMRKPEPEIFEKVLASLGVAAENALFLDDNPMCTAGAEDVGIRSILVEDPASAARQLLSELEG